MDNLRNSRIHIEGISFLQGMIRSRTVTYVFRHGNRLPSFSSPAEDQASLCALCFHKINIHFYGPSIHATISAFITFLDRYETNALNWRARGFGNDRLLNQSKPPKACESSIYNCLLLRQKHWLNQYIGMDQYAAGLFFSAIIQVSIIL